MPIPLAERPAGALPTRTRVLVSSAPRTVRVSFRTSFPVENTIPRQFRMLEPYHHEVLKAIVHS
jgi:hypothetical protein